MGIAATPVASSPSTDATSTDAVLPAAVTAYLTRFKGQSRQHSASDLGVFTTWCSDRGLDPLTVQRGHLEPYLRWLQETRHYKPSTVSRRLSVVAGFYRTAVIDGVLEHSPPSTSAAPECRLNHPPWG